MKNAKCKKSYRNKQPKRKMRVCLAFTVVGLINLSAFILVVTGASIDNMTVLTVGFCILMLELLISGFVYCADICGAQWTKKLDDWFEGRDTPSRAVYEYSISDPNDTWQPYLGQRTPTDLSAPIYYPAEHQEHQEYQERGSDTPLDFYTPPAYVYQPQARVLHDVDGY